jgi:hypothetical protein
MHRCKTLLNTIVELQIRIIIVITVHSDVLVHVYIVLPYFYTNTVVADIWFNTFYWITVIKSNGSYSIYYYLFINVL